MHYMSTFESALKHVSNGKWCPNCVKPFKQPDKQKFDWCKNKETNKRFLYYFVIRVVGATSKSPGNTNQESYNTVVPTTLFVIEDKRIKVDGRQHLEDADDFPICLYMSKDENIYCQYQSTTPSS